MIPGYSGIIANLIRALTFGLVVGLAVGLADRAVYTLVNRLATGLVAGLAVVLVVWLGSVGSHGAAVGVAIGLAVGLVYGFADRLIVVLVVEFLVLLLQGLGVGLQVRIGFELVITLMVGLAAALVAGLANGLIHGFACRFGLGIILNSKKKILTLDRPSDLLRENFVLTFLFVLTGGLMYGVVVGLVTMLAFGVAGGLATMLAFGLEAVLVVGLPIAFGVTSWPRFMIANMLGARRRALPPQLAAFPDWAYDAGLLRLSGIECQFRHAELQRWLIREQAEPIEPSRIDVFPEESLPSLDVETSPPIRTKLGFSGQKILPRQLRTFPALASLSIVVVAILGAIFIIFSSSTNTIIVGTHPFCVAVSPDGRRIYVTNGGSNTVSVIDTVTNKVIIVIPVEVDPVGVAVSPDGVTPTSEMPILIRFR